MASKRSGKQLTAAFVRNTTSVGVHGDGRGGYGLQLKVDKIKKTGRLTKIYRQKLTIVGAGKKGSDLETTRRIGRHPDITLQEARETAKKNASLATKGIDPKKHEETVPSIIPTIRELAPMALNTITNPQARRESESMLTRFVYPHFGNKPLDEIQTRELYDVLLPLYQSTQTVGPRLAAVLTLIFQHGKTFHNVPNPIDPALLDLMPPRSTPVIAYPSLPYQELPSAMKRIDQRKGTGPITKSALKTTILSGLRLTSAIGGQWNEFFWKKIENDFDWDPGSGWEPVDWSQITSNNDKTIVWIIPAWRMKSREEFRLPVSSALLQILLEMLEERGKHPGDSRYIFPSLKNQGHIFQKTVGNLINKLNLPSDKPPRHAVIHGFRSTLRKWCHDLGVHFLTAELALSHKLPPTVSAYLRTDLLRERAPVMEAWGEYANGHLTLPTDDSMTPTPDDPLRAINHPSPLEKYISEYKETRHGK